MEAAVLAGALDLDDARSLRAPCSGSRRAGTGSIRLKDIQAQVLAMEAGITSRRKVVEATGYDIEEVDRENAADVKRAADLGLGYRTSPGETQGARATPPHGRMPRQPDGGAASEQSEQE